MYEGDLYIPEDEMPKFEKVRLPKKKKHPSSDSESFGIVE